MKINKDSYIFVDVEWKTGFKHRIATRGFMLKSALNDLATISWIKEYTWKEVSEQQFVNYLKNGK